MKKSVLLITILIPILILLLPAVFADSIEQGISKEISEVLHYAEQFEVGNINYAQLWMHIGSGQANLNSILGTSGEGVTTALELFLGEPDYTQWIWIENQGHQTKIDPAVPTWNNKVLFDGTIQIRISVKPIIFSKNNIQKLVYKSNIVIDLKKPILESQVIEKVKEVETLSEIFYEEPTTENAEQLAKASVEAERSFKAFSEQDPKNYEEQLENIIGEEYKTETQEVVVEEFKIYEDPEEEYVITAQLETSEDKSIHLVMDIKGKGEELVPETKTTETAEFFGDSEDLQIEIEATLEKFTREIVYEDFNIISAVEFAKELTAINNLLNKEIILEPIEVKVAREAIKETTPVKPVEEPTPVKEVTAIEASPTRITGRAVTGEAATGETTGESITGIVGTEEDEEEGEKEINEKLRISYGEREQIYREVLSNFQKTAEYSFTQTEFIKKTVQIVGDENKEICTNKIDDNDNGKIDCKDDLCAGKICETQTTQNLYCIERTCKAKDPPREITTVCGNQICELGEKTTCSKDCITCHPNTPIGCLGDVIFRGEDKNGCPLDPLCLEKKTTCAIKDDCPKTLCGTIDCVEGQCQTFLGKCEIPECVSGINKIQTCVEGGSIIVERCINALWKETGVKCDVAIGEAEEVATGKGSECSIKEDCGMDNSICSNGWCIIIPKNTIPPIIEIEENIRDDQIIEGEKRRVEAWCVEDVCVYREKTESSPSITGGVITGEPITGIARTEEPESYSDEEFVSKKLSEEKDAFIMGGIYRNDPKETGAFMFFNGEGENFDAIQELKQEYYAQGSETCQENLANAIAERKEIENSFNQEFLAQFFEQNLVNSDYDWEKQTMGIENLYKKIVENQEDIVANMDCLGGNKLENYNLIDIYYKSGRGGISYKEQLANVRFSNLRNSVQIIKPSLVIWITPSKEIVENAMQQAMERNEFFLGSVGERTERKNNGGFTTEEREILSKDKSFQKKLQNAPENIVIEIKNENNVVYNLYMNVNGDDFTIEPMLPEEVPKQDIKMEIDFNDFYDMYLASEESIEKSKTKVPSWADKGFNPIKAIRNFFTEISFSLKMKDVIDSSVVSPASSEKQVKSLLDTILPVIMQEDIKDTEKIKEISSSIWDSEQEITGNI